MQYQIYSAALYANTTTTDNLEDERCAVSELSENTQWFWYQVTRLCLFNEMELSVLV